ncbi:MAG: DUF6673 family protein [Sarcina sp.]
MKINNVELEFDAYDAEQIQLIEIAAVEMDKVIQDTPVDITWADNIRYQCNEIFKFFDKVFGEGTSKQLFGDKTNLRVCNEALAELLEQAHLEIKEVNDSVTKKFSKYIPNRAQRRSK